MKVLVACGSAKKDKPAPAGELYTGGLFRSALRYARTLAADPDIFILSALHGLIPLDRITAPYNLRVGQPGSITAAALAAQASNLGVLMDPDVVVCGGIDYARLARRAIPHVRSVCSVIAVEMPSGSMGYMMQWYRDNSGRAP